VSSERLYLRGEGAEGIKLFTGVVVLTAYPPQKWKIA
jgi:hypothetical protein